MQTQRTLRHGKNTAPLVAATFATLLLTASALNAQTAPPTPQSVAPGFTAPANSTYPARPAFVFAHSRAYTWDFYLIAGYTFNDSSDFNNISIFNPFANEGAGANTIGNMRFKLDDAFNFGFGFNYNIDEHFAVGAEFAYSRPSYDASFTVTNGPDAGSRFRITGRADVYTGNAFVQYNFTSRNKWTPYIRGNLGFYWMDTGIPTGPTQFYWWWDWWWGRYFVVGSTPTKSDTYLTLGATAGLRYDFDNHVYATGAYDASWINTRHDWMLSQRISLAIGWNY